ncbi:MAG: RloB domain-containing protein [Lewinellaceae bacterium]|nr:RloB domain-containing protein [Lewinellaceae bacterium]
MKMKDKKAGQIRKKERHRRALKAAKERRRGEPSLERPKPFKAERPTILIVCEGRNTEPSYFRQFRLSSATIKAIGEGYNTVSLVNRAAQLAKEKDFEQVWCVFDKDIFSDNDFNNAIVMAQSLGFGVAYSNQAFEYWIILHFEDHQGGGMHRSTYVDKINSYLQPLGVEFDRNSKTISEEIFSILEEVDQQTKASRIRLAINRAQRIYNSLTHHSPAKEESSTTVFKLVEEILKYV